jgi:hypothetical protein
VSLFRPRSARGPSGLSPRDQPTLLVRGDDRAARAVGAIDEMFAAAPADEPGAWARFQARRDRRQRGAGWRWGAGVVAAASLAASAFVLGPGRKAPREQAEPIGAAPAIVTTAARPAPAGAEAPRARTADAQTEDKEAPPSERPAADAAPLAAGTSVLSPGVRARLSRGGRATYFRAKSAEAYLLLERGTLVLESGAGARHDARAAERPLEVRAADWQLRGGGRFKVAARGRRVDVAVERGEVAVWSSVRLVARVVAGERWTSSPAAAPPAPSDPEREPRDCLRLARDGVTRDAIACLESQSAEPGLAGEVALLELARVRRDVKDDLAGAERLLADHERRFPHSGLAPEARAARIELLLRLGRPAEALVEAQRLGGSEAIYWRAVSLAALGRRDEARGAFDEYLRRPDIQRRREAVRKQSELVP